MFNLWQLLDKVLVHGEGKTFLVEGSGYMLGWGTTLPSDGAPGWHPGAVFIDTNATGMRLFVNVGTAAECNFDAAGDATPFGTLAAAAGKILVGDGNVFQEKAVSGDALLSATGVLTVLNKLHSSIADPGAANKAIPVTGSGICKLTVADATAEERTLDLPTYAGQLIAVQTEAVGSGGTCKLTLSEAFDEAGNTDITFNAAGQYAILYGIDVGATFRWRLLACTPSLAAASRPESVIADPGSVSQAIPVTRSGICGLTVSNAPEARTIDNPVVVGQQLLLYVASIEEGGEVAVTAASPVNTEGNNTLTFDAAGQAITLRAIAQAGDLRWSVQGNDGVTLSTEQV